MLCYNIFEVIYVIMKNHKKILLAVAFIILLVLFLVFDVYSYIGLDQMGNLKE
jgi:hypothetical protein